MKIKQWCIAFVMLFGVSGAMAQERDDVCEGLGYVGQISPHMWACFDDDGDIIGGNPMNVCGPQFGESSYIDQIDDNMWACHNEGGDIIGGNPMDYCQRTHGPEFSLYGFDGENRFGCYDEDGYGVLGYDEDGYNRDGFDQVGVDRDGYDGWGFNEDGYNRDGYDARGLDQDGIERDGWDKDVVDWVKCPFGYDLYWSASGDPNCIGGDDGSDYVKEDEDDDDSDFMDDDWDED